MTPTDSRQAALDDLETRNRACTACALRPAALQVVVSDGPRVRPLFIIGELPGGGEDREGRPFVGPGGELLDRILAAVGLNREQAYLTNIMKCRPPGRAPRPAEVQTCTELWLHAQLQLLRPSVILTLGNTSSQTLLRTQQGITALRGHWYQYVLPGVPQPGQSPQTAWLRPMLHPAYLLRVESRAPGGPRSLTWHDIQEVAAVLKGEKTPQASEPGDPPRLL